jgi:hypothetical protein
MATVDLPVVLGPVDTTTDVGEIWKEAVNRYEEIAKVKVESLPQVNSIDAVLSETRKRDRIFQSYRHDETKLDKFRTLVSKSLSPIEKASTIVASAASIVRKQHRLLVDYGQLCAEVAVVVSP